MEAEANSVVSVVVPARNESGNIQGAISTCQSSNAPVTRIIAAGLRRAGGSEHDVQQAMDEEALRELPKIEKRTGYLAMLTVASRSAWKGLKPLAAGALLTIVVTAPVTSVYLAARAEHGERFREGVQPYSAVLRDYLAARNPKK